MRSAPRQPLHVYVCASAVALALALGLAACGSGGSATTTTSLISKHQPKTLDVYASLPLHGAQAAQGHSVLNGIRLALIQAGRKAGPFKLRLITRDDAGPYAHGWTASATLANARQAATNPLTILYIGELDSHASARSLPILNNALIPQISPGSPATDLTGTSAADRARFRSSGSATFFQLVPDDGYAAKANLYALYKLGCEHTALVGDNSGTELLADMRADASEFGLHVARLGRTSQAPTSSAAIASYVAKARASGDCVFYAGTATPQALALTRSLREQLPATAAVVGSSTLCDATWARRAETLTTATETTTSQSGGASLNGQTDSPATQTTTGSTSTAPPPASTPRAGATTTGSRTAGENPTANSPRDPTTVISTTPGTTTPTTTTTPSTTTGTSTTPGQTTPTASLWCTSPTPDLSKSVLGRAFIADYRKEFHSNPDLPAIFGYEAMQVGVRAIRALGAGGDSRTLLLAELHDWNQNQDSVSPSALGPPPFTFNTTGGSSVASYGLYHVTAGGALDYDLTLQQTSPVHH